MKVVRNKTLVSAIVLALALMTFAGYAIADPIGAPVDVIESTRADIGGDPGEVYAEAGNMTQLSLNASALSTYWTGFYGNISGNYTLENGDGYKMYEWGIGEGINGEVYASRHSSPTWAGIGCADGNEIGDEESALGFVHYSGENINDTFDNETLHHPTFSVGTQEIASSDDCWTAHTYVNNASQSGTDIVFAEVMLEDTGDQTVWATVINDSATGFNNQDWEFQMLVPENGKGDEADTRTLYYFWVELA